MQSPAANRVEGLFKGVDCHSFMYQEWAGRANSRQQVRTLGKAASCLEQYLVPSSQ